MAGVLAHDRFPKILRAGRIEEPETLTDRHQVLRAFVRPIWCRHPKALTRSRFVLGRTHLEASWADPAHALGDGFAFRWRHLEVDPQPEAVAADGTGPGRLGDLRKVSFSQSVAITNARPCGRRHVASPAAGRRTNSAPRSPVSPRPVCASRPDAATWSAPPAGPGPAWAAAPQRGPAPDRPAPLPLCAAALTRKLLNRAGRKPKLP